MFDNLHNPINWALGIGGSAAVLAADEVMAIVVGLVTVAGIVINTLINWLRYKRDGRRKR